jgi:transposase-like protein
MFNRKRFIIATDIANRNQIWNWNIQFRGRKSTSNPIKNSNITNHQSQLVLSSKENQSSDDFENKCNRASHATGLLVDLRPLNIP